MARGKLSRKSCRWLAGSHSASSRRLPGENPADCSFLVRGWLLRPGTQTKQPPKAPVAPYTIPEGAVHQANPVNATPESIAQGKKWYGYDCAMCHGKDGDGKGDVGADMKLKVSDFTDPTTLEERTDGELFYIIKFGKADMPPEGARVKTDELWDLVNYVRSLAKKSPSADKTAR
jgi:mono/diheme cytochrome c family protein